MSTAKELIAISACLQDVKVKYNGDSNLDLQCKDNVLLICPEVYGGLSIPRNPVEIQGKVNNQNTYDALANGLIRIVDKNNNDFSQQFLKGAQLTLKMLRKYQIKKVILKANSPSCGLSNIYDGTFSKNLIVGQGVLASLLSSEGYEVIEM